MNAVENEVLTTGARRSLAWIDLPSGEQIREYAGTFATEFAVLVSQLIVYRMAAQHLGKAGFAEYAVARRTINLIYPIALLGLGIALPRYLGLSSNRHDGRVTKAYFGAALCCAVCGAGLCMLTMNAFPAKIAFVFFGSTNYARVVFPLSLMMVGLVLHGVVYSYFRGNLNMSRANGVQLANLSFVPLIAFTRFGSSIRQVLLALGLMWTAVALVALLFTPWQSVVIRGFDEVTILLRYGLQRVPGDFIAMALFSLPSTFVAHMYGMQDAGFVAFGTSMLTMVGSAFAPIGLILLPKASQMVGRGALPELREHFAPIIKLTLIGSLFLTGVVEITAYPVIRVYLGPGFENLVIFVRILAIGIVPYCVYIVSRGLIDAVEHKAINTRNLFCAFVVFNLLSAIVRLASLPAIWIAGALLLSIVTLGALCSYTANQFLRPAESAHKVPS
jgi:O-antigen/teichoic acid export membrane protein